LEMQSIPGSLLIVGSALLFACSSGSDRPPSAYVAEVPPIGSGPDAAVPPPSDEGTYQRAACPFVPPTGVTVECGYLTVAEDRRASSPAQRGKLQLAVAVFKSRAPSSAATPLLYLDGGPGGPALDDVVGAWSLFALFAERHDFVVFDQRGTGHSQPLLSCTGSDAYDGSSSPEASAARSLALHSCHDELAAKVMSLSNFDSASSAADVDELRTALGYPRWNLFGVSYGTRLALTVARDFPAGVGSLVIDSVLPPQVDAFAEAGANANRAFEHIFDGCSSQPSCAAAFPALRQDFYDTITALSTKPATIVLNDGNNVVLDADLVIELLFSICYVATVIPYVPQLIDELHRETYANLTSILSNVASAPTGLALGMNLSVVCREMAPFTSRQAIAEANADLQPVLGTHFTAVKDLDICDIWNVAPAAPLEHLPVASDLPSLVLSGGYDPVTPPAWGRAAASTLSRGTFLELAAQSHAAFKDTCARGVVDRFSTDPSAPLDVDCVGSRPALAFVAPPPSATAALVRSRGADALLPDDVLASIRRRASRF
jgi:pimeloyl-ACP methyl ester carboxylesterase